VLFKTFKEMMTYAETLEYMFARLPMYQRIGGAAYKADLINTLQLCSKLGNPERQFAAVHIAGTNGKGSVSNLVASVLQEAGFKTGLYTSPHYRDFRERIKIDGREIPEEKVVAFIDHYRPMLEEIELSFFEMTVGMAFRYFADEQVDIAVVEVGMGGRLDSTNVITPLVSVITNIGLDHTQFLGNTLAKIAIEKAGIIKHRVPVVIGETQPEIKAAFENIAHEHSSPITFADQNWQITTENLQQVNILFENKPFLSTQLPLQGSYQYKNLRTALEAIRQIENTRFKVSKEIIAAGIKNVVINTGFRGRWQVLSMQPLTIADSGHNAHGLQMVIDNINATPYRELHIVIGVVNDKNLDAMMKLLPKDAHYYFCKANIPRALPAEELAQMAAKWQLRGAAYPSVSTAWQAAQQQAYPDDLIFIGGSTFVVAEVV
jgi:dihydrofolate synthase/folylpolyglutamate synthase